MRRMAGLLVLLLVVAGTRLSAQQEGLTRKGPLQDQAMEAEASRIASGLRCPVCQGLSIQDSPSPLAQEMKDVIRTQLSAGRSEDQIQAYFVSKYGEWVLLAPRAAGFNLLVYLLPALVLLAGGGLIVLSVRRWTTAAPRDGEAGQG